MIDVVKKFFCRTVEGRDQNRDGTQGHDVRVASCALLLEMSRIDGEFDALERDRILTILKDDFKMQDGHALELLRVSEEELEKHVDLWKFTNLINRNYSPEEKIGIIETIWTIAYLDGELDKHEDYLIHKLARLLNLDHGQLIDAKLKVKGQLKKSTGGELHV